MQSITKCSRFNVVRMARLGKLLGYLRRRRETENANMRTGRRGESSSMSWIAGFSNRGLHRNRFLGLRRGRMVQVDRLVPLHQHLPGHERRHIRQVSRMRLGNRRRLFRQFNSNHALFNLALGVSGIRAAYYAVVGRTSDAGSLLLGYHRRRRSGRSSSGAEFALDYRWERIYSLSSDV